MAVDLALLTRVCSGRRDSETLEAAWVLDLGTACLDGDEGLAEQDLSTGSDSRV